MKGVPPNYFKTKEGCHQTKKVHEQWPWSDPMNEINTKKDCLTVSSDVNWQVKYDSFTGLAHSLNLKLTLIVN